MTLLDDRPTADETSEFPRQRTLPPLPALPRNLTWQTDHPGTRMGWTIACVLLVTMGVQAWSTSTLWFTAAIASVLMIPIALVGMALCWTSRDGLTTRMQALVLGATAAYVAIATAQGILNAPAYGTDAVAFGQYAAELVAKGENPYAASMLPSLLQYHVPAIYNTHFLDGHSMDQMSYPAGNFLAYVPFALIGWHTQMAIVVDVVFWIVSGFLLWRVLPAPVRFAAPILMGSTLYLSFAVGGVNDTLYMPFLILAAWRWDRFADPTERSMARWIGPIAMGLAMSIKQTPWFLFPFLVIGLTLEARGPDGIRWRTPIRYAATVGAVFLTVNAPWIVIDPMT